MKKIPYWEQLKDPRWQRKRLEILSRANFKCEHCGSEEKTLDIHHRFYQKNLMAWEYPTGSLICVCCDCHETVQENERAFLSALPGGETGILPHLAELITRLKPKGVSFTAMVEALYHMEEHKLFWPPGEEGFD